MDALNQQILSLLQEDGRMSTTDLAARVGLSLSSCHRRVKELETSGAIEGYRAIVSPDRLGLTFEAIVFVTMNVTDRPTVAAFEDAVADEPSIVTAQRLFGEPDYLLRVLAPDLAGYQELYDTRLAVLPGVQRLTSTMVMKRIGAEHLVPVP
ncbi:Lrp/AsnC family transcriptional regulator [Pseudoclavibacter chungangensis]|uniref:Lrp/AsnC family transcriptional regulator n=1 Tax=Pseudoclavibacter chungangensis TaxID=587635 RepID=A0A7J5C055_9MICO|nr:Lrp/AsnC family transcriptional regulator [Pseudoclavibacter chungangensis]KAB1660291.1 Lrp/AsnC family transcriptional regulator [Pseudoclavibacter chungangensis]NYJ65639.1 DNA-binding Lrp family transcriptional regulator [Pseudoclavibacter chungangensis]